MERAWSLIEGFVAQLGGGSRADARSIRRAIAIVPLWGLIVLAAVTVVPPPLRGIALLLALLGIVLAFGRKDALFVVALASLALAMSEDQPNTLKDFFERDGYGSLWAAFLFGSVTASDLYAAVVVGLSLAAIMRSPLAGRISKIDLVFAFVGLMLLYGVARGLIGRLPEEQWRFWFFDVRAALYIAGGYIVGRTLVLGPRPLFIARLGFASFAVVFLLTAIQFSIVPTGFKAINGGNIPIISEIALLAGAYVLCAGALSAWSSRGALTLWAAGAGVMTVVDFIAGRRTGLLLIIAGLIVLGVVAGRRSLRLASYYALSVLVCLAIVAVLDRATLNDSVDAIAVTVQTAPEAVSAGVHATAAPVASPLAAPTAAQTIVPVATGDPRQQAAITGTETRVGEVRNVIDTLRARSGLFIGLGFGKLWQVLTPQADDYFAVGPRSGLYGTPYRFNLHLPGIDYLLRFGIIGSALLVLAGSYALLTVWRWPRSGHDRAIAIAAIAATALMLSYWGNPRSSFVEGLMLALVRVVEPQSLSRPLREWVATIRRARDRLR